MIVDPLVFYPASCVEPAIVSFDNGVSGLLNRDHP